jgi:hypothetical protein
VPKIWKRDRPTAVIAVHDGILWLVIALVIGYKKLQSRFKYLIFSNETFSFNVTKAVTTEQLEEAVACLTVDSAVELH